MNDEFLLGIEAWVRRWTEGLAIVLLDSFGEKRFSIPGLIVGKDTNVFRCTHLRVNPPKLRK